MNTRLLPCSFSAFVSTALLLLPHTAIDSAAGVDLAELIVSDKQYGAVKSLAFSPGGTLLAVAGSNRRISLLKPSDGTLIRSIDIPQGGVDIVTFNNTGRALASARANEIVIWNTADGSVLHTARQRMGRIVSLDFNSDGTLIASSGSDTQIRVFDTENLFEEYTISPGGISPSTVNFSPEGPMLAGMAGNRAFVWNLNDIMNPRKFAGHRGNVSCCLFTSGGGGLVTGGNDKRVVLWDVETGKQTKSFTDHTGRILTLAASRDGKLLASAAGDKTVILRRGNDAEALLTIDGLPRNALSIALSPKAAYLACGMRGPGTSFMLWRLDTESLYAGYGVVVAEIEVDYLTKREEEVLTEQNRLRTDPAAYVKVAERYRKRYKENVYRVHKGRDIITKEGIAAVDEAINFLAMQKPVPPLLPSKGLSQAAKDHCVDTGPKGLTTHTGTDMSRPEDRMARYGRLTGASGENMAFGLKEPRDIIMQLLVDDGLPGRPHRENLFSADFRMSGVNVRRHSNFGVMCVITYAGEYVEK